MKHEPSATSFCVHQLMKNVAAYRLRTVRVTCYMCMQHEVHRGKHRAVEFTQLRAFMLEVTPLSCPEDICLNPSTSEAGHTDKASELNELLQKGGLQAPILEMGTYPKKSKTLGEPNKM